MRPIDERLMMLDLAGVLLSLLLGPESHHLRGLQKWTPVSKVCMRDTSHDDEDFRLSESV
jgi:hypothetical protein